MVAGMTKELPPIYCSLMDPKETTEYLKLDSEAITP